MGVFFKRETFVNLKNLIVRDFPGSTEVKTPHSQHKMQILISGQGTKIPHDTQHSQNK